jgi:Na+-driven multidrug efflux pump
MSEEKKEDASGAGGRHSRAAILDGPIQGTLFRLAWPMAVTSLINGWQVVASMFWVGRLIGTAGLSTLAVMEPVLTILGLISGATYVGVQVLTAKATGSQDEKAIPIIVNGGYLAMLWALIVSVVGLILIAPITNLLAGNVGIEPSLKSYLIPWLLFYTAPVIGGVTMFAVSATGWTRFGLIQTVLSIAFVVTLTPLFIAGFDLGIAGVAISDGSADTLLLLLTGFVLYKYRSDLGLGQWRRSHWRLDFSLWRKIAGVGVFYQAARAMDFVAQALMVRIIMESGRAADVAAYGVTLTLIGTTTGAISCIGVAASIMIGQNVGAKKLERARQIVGVAIAWLATIGCGLVLLASYPEPLIGLFTDDPVVISQAADTVAGLRWTMPAGLVSGALLRIYTAVSANKLGNSLSIICALLAIVIASVLPGEPLTRVTAGLVTSWYVRLVVLALFYRRSFGAALARST